MENQVILDVSGLIFDDPSPLSAFSKNVIHDKFFNFRVWYQLIHKHRVTTKSSITLPNFELQELEPIEADLPLRKEERHVRNPN